MTSFSRALVAAVALLGLWIAPAAAQLIGRPLEFSAGAGYYGYDTRARVDDGLSFHGRIGWRAYPWLTLEASGVFGPSQADTFPGQDHNLLVIGGDMRWDLRNAGDKVVPFFLTGFGYGLSHTIGHKPDNLERGAPSLGMGVLMNVMPRAYVRLQARDVFFRERDAKEFSNHVEASASFQVQWGGRFRDEDYDGVRDWLDHCIDTPIGATVDQNGCPSDADQDSVFDGLDRCDNTPLGCVVDEHGCPVDTDGDGVCDGLDQCADTPMGKEVNAQGCPVDLDGDGVKIPDDKCPETPPGCKVDASGCSTDSDGDGVCDGVDECPNTPAGAEVNEKGCPTHVSQMEQALIDSAVIRTSAVTFAPGRSELKGDETFAVLDSIGMILQQYPMLQFEIGGHTDSQGGQAANEKLSLERAEAVFDYLKGKFPLINTDMVTVHGYGPARPVAPNTTAAGRALNRRVEFKVMNADTLQQIRDRRNLMMMLESGQ